MWAHGPSGAVSGSNNTADKGEFLLAKRMQSLQKFPVTSDPRRWWYSWEHDSNSLTWSRSGASAVWSRRAAVFAPLVLVEQKVKTDGIMSAWDIVSDSDQRRKEKKRSQCCSLLDWIGADFISLKTSRFKSHLGIMKRYPGFFHSWERMSTCWTLVAWSGFFSFFLICSYFSGSR